MDKYRRNDDMNDDLDVYNQEDNDSLTIFESNTPNQQSYTQGVAEPDGECIDNFNKVKARLSPQENVLMELILKGLSIRKASKKMNISQQMASKYWKRIKEKLR